MHTDAIADAQVSTNNVVVMYVDYKPSPADARSPEAQTIGTGDVMVFTDGKVDHGHLDPRRPAAAVHAHRRIAAAAIRLTPGRTFVELARTGAAASVPVGTAFNAVPFP